MSFFSNLGDDISDFFSNIGDKFSSENEERRREDRALENELEDEEIPLKIVKVDFKAKENSSGHNTEKFELVTRGKGTAIIRRGAYFVLDLELNQPADLKKAQQLKIYFNFGPRPLVNKGTQAILEITGKRLLDKEKDEWDYRVVKHDGNIVTLEIFCPHDVPVGVWLPIFEIRERGHTDITQRHIFRPEEIIYILFNPWVKDDDVYLKDEEHRQEYVLNDVGKIWMGGYPTATGREWVFGQFDDAVLPACIIMLERAGVKMEQRGDPIVVTRAVSRIVNSNDRDKGVLVGRWDEKYDDGTAPGKWTGSISILEDYMRKKTSIKYGQCWVFSGVTTTVCRALGIPCRCVTNLNSAHDTNKSLTIDKYYDTDGKDFKPNGDVMPEGLNDSIWNFHVWNDVWMARPDLPPGYGGWQAIDATPQEESHGFYQLGPASLVAVRKGKVNLHYDVDFVMAEVNADLVKWQRSEFSKDGFRKLNSLKEHIGRQVITKKCGEIKGEIEDREDITTEYKPPERTNAERVILHSAARRTRAARHAYRFPSIVEEDIEFELVDIERIMIGDDFTITINVKNLVETNRTVQLYLYASSEYYHGSKAHIIKQAEGKFKFGPKESDKLSLSVTYADYFDKLVEHALIKIDAMASVEETTQTWSDEDTFQILKPVITIEVPEEEGTVGTPQKLKFSFKNPLEVALEKCTLIIDGPGLSRPKKIPIESIPAKEEMIHEMKIYPKKSGKRTLICTFNSSKLVNITGSKAINILDKY